MQPEESGGPLLPLLDYRLLLAGGGRQRRRSRLACSTSSVAGIGVDIERDPKHAGTMHTTTSIGTTSSRRVNADGRPFPLEGKRNLATALLSSRHDIFDGETRSHPIERVKQRRFFCWQ
ncbi:hypothetical protein MTO96_035226 [Rhipicephalus appendiculatus]